MEKCNLQWKKMGRVFRRVSGDRHAPFDTLVLILSQGKVAMDPVKVAGVCNWPVPYNVTEVRSFLGLINFYCCFVEDFSHIARPLNQLQSRILRGLGKQIDQSKKPLTSSSTSSLQHQSLSFLTKPSIFLLKPMPQHMQQVQFYPSFVMMGNGDQ